jgi:hypothetical protein
MAEVLEVQDMLANTYEPKRKFRWILQIEGIDAFLYFKNFSHILTPAYISKYSFV